MRKLLLAITAAAAVLSVATFATSRAQAMAIAPANGLQAAIEDASITHEARTVCRHRYYSSGTRCWWRPGYYHHYGYYGPRWRHRHWGYRRWRHW